MRSCAAAAAFLFGGSISSAARSKAVGQVEQVGAPRLVKLALGLFSQVARAATVGAGSAIGAVIGHANTRGLIRGQPMPYFNNSDNTGAYLP